MISIEKIELSKIKPYENNAKIHTKEQIEQIKKSIEEFGMNDPIAIWGGNNLIVEGHGRYEALKELGYKEVDCVRLDHLTDEQRKAYTLVHNQLTMNTGFDLDILNEELAKLENMEMDFFGFDIDTAQDQMVDLQEDDYEIQEDLPTKTKQGQIWKLGNHRLMVGDSACEKDVQMLVHGETIDLVVTDPPYNVNIQNSQGMTIENDNMSSTQFKDFLINVFKNMNAVLKDGGSFYIWHCTYERVNFETSLNECGLRVRQEIIWNKNTFNLGRADYQWKHEPCLYGWKEGKAHYFVDDRTLSSVIELEDKEIESLKKEELVTMLKDILSNAKTSVIDEKKPSKNELHPTMKPIRLVGRQIENSSKRGQNVLDLFGGSGSTLIACEQLSRNCLMMEYDPKYADVIIDRWEKQTGRQAELISERE